jgi:hypothetical protein
MSAAVSGVTSRGAWTVGANVVRVRERVGTMIPEFACGANRVVVRDAVLGVTRRGAETVGANVLVVRLATPAVTRRGVETTGAKVVRESERTPGVTSLGAATAGARVVVIREAVPGVASRAMTGANRVSVRDATPGVTTLGAETVGANAVRVSDALPIVASRGVAAVGANAVRLSVALPTVTSRGVRTTGANVVSVRVATPGVAVWLALTVSVGTIDGRGCLTGGGTRNRPRGGTGYSPSRKVSVAFQLVSVVGVPMSATTIAWSGPTVIRASGTGTYSQPLRLLKASTMIGVSVPPPSAEALTPELAAAIEVEAVIPEATPPTMTAAGVALTNVSNALALAAIWTPSSWPVLVPCWLTRHSRIVRSDARDENAVAARRPMSEPLAMTVPALKLTV